VTLAAFSTCNRPGCPTLVKGNKFCPIHAEQAKQREYSERNADEVMKLYRTQRWERFKRYMRARNPLCQRILEDGTQCEQFSTILHHIVSPRVTLHLMFDAENILCVCAQHHPNTPGELDPSRYVKTVT
jgi:hypothetical protein